MSPTEDREPFLRALWDLRAYLPNLVLIGGWVPALHRRYGSDGEWASSPVHTLELDLLTSADAEAPSVPGLSAALRAAGFAPVDSNDPPAVWERGGPEATERIEFFVDHRGPAEGVASVTATTADESVGALRLPDLRFLAEETVSIEVPLDDRGDGEVASVFVTVPSLPRFAIHKGVTFAKRRDRQRAAKDLLYIVEILAAGTSVQADLEAGIAALCKGGGYAAQMARTARNNVSLVKPGTGMDPTLRLLAEMLAERAQLSTAAAVARALGFLDDFTGMIPPDCGD